MARARSSPTALARLLNDAATPLYVLDHARCVVFANAAMLRLLGVAEEDLLGKRCDYAAGAGAGLEPNCLASLCPPPDLFDRNSASFPFSYSAGSNLIQGRAECQTLRGGSAEIAAVVVKLAVDERAESRASPGLPTPCEDESRLLHERLVALRRQTGARLRWEGLVGQSSVMRRVRAQAEAAARANASVVVVGPAGSGREHLARAIHLARGEEQPGPLVPLPCPLLDAETLQLSVRRLKRRPSGGEHDHPGVLLLLEVDQMPADAQDELAGFLALPDFQLTTLATARRSLLQLASAAGFRYDLACQLSTFNIQLPPLAERREDIPLLAQMLLECENAAGGEQLAGFTSEAIDELCAYPWPGNLDELTQFVREACRRAVGPKVGTPDLPARIRLAAEAAAHPAPAEETLVLDDFLAEIERELMQRALRRAKGNRSTAARWLGIPRARLLRRLVQLGLAEAAPREGQTIVFEEVVHSSDETEPDHGGPTIR